MWLEIIDMAASEDGVGIENVGLRETLTSLDRSIQSLILFFQGKRRTAAGVGFVAVHDPGRKAGNGQNHSGRVRVLVVILLLCARTWWTSPAAAMRERTARSAVLPRALQHTLHSTRGRRREHELLVLLRAQHPELKAHRHPPAGHLNMERVAVGYFAAAEAARQVTSIVAGSCLLAGRCALIQWASPLSSSHAAAFLRDAAGSRPMGFAEQFTCCRKQVAAGPHLP